MVSNHEKVIWIAGKLKPKNFLIFCTGTKAVPALSSRHKIFTSPKLHLWLPCDSAGNWGKQSYEKFYLNSMLLAQSYTNFLHSVQVLAARYQIPSSSFVFDREPKKHLGTIVSAWGAFRLLSILTPWFLVPFIFRLGQPRLLQLLYISLIYTDGARLGQYSYNQW